MKDSSTSLIIGICGLFMMAGTAGDGTYSTILIVIASVLALILAKRALSKA